MFWTGNPSGGARTSCVCPDIDLFECMIQDNRYCNMFANMFLEILVVRHIFIAGLQQEWRRSSWRGRNYETMKYFKSSIIN